MATLGQYYDQLPDMSAQEVAEAALTHLIEQGARSGRFGYGGSEGAFVCEYRDREGRCCAAGPFVSPIINLERHNNTSYPSLVELNLAHTNHESLIRDLQCIHDEFPPERWIDEARHMPGINWDFLDNLIKQGDN